MTIIILTPSLQFPGLVLLQEPTGLPSLPTKKCTLGRMVSPLLTMIVLLLVLMVFVLLERIACALLDGRALIVPYFTALAVLIIQLVLDPKTAHAILDGMGPAVIASTTHTRDWDMLLGWFLARLCH